MPETVDTLCGVRSRRFMPLGRVGKTSGSFVDTVLMNDRYSALNQPLGLMIW